MAKYILGPLFDKDYPVTQGYGANPDYYKQFGLPGHEGVDYGTPNGTPILAPFDGTILRDTFGDKDYGNFTIIWDSVQKCAVWFCHLQDVMTVIGQQVKKGDIIGHTNNTGNTTGPHCHVNFVETDAVGNRLNKDNGYQGFLNILDTNLVEFLATTGNNWQQQIDYLQKQLDQKNKDYDVLYQEYQNALHSISDDKTTIDNLNQVVNDRNNNITTLNAKIQTLETQLTAAQGQVDILTPIAGQVPGLKLQLDQSITDRTNCFTDRDKLKKQLASYQGSKPKTFFDRLKYLFNI